MSRIMDVDEAILGHALKLLAAVQRREPVVHVDLLEDIPRLIVHLFEHVTTEPIPDNLKPFGSFRERSETLQMILDTLEQMLGLSLSHVTGVGLAQLDRRQLADTLEIFDDLLRYSLRSGDRLAGQQADSSSDEKLTMSLLNTPDSAIKEFRTRDHHKSKQSEQASLNNDAVQGDYTIGNHVNGPGQLRRPYQYKDSGRSPIVEVRPMAPAVWQNDYEKRTGNGGFGQHPRISRQVPPTSRVTDQISTGGVHSISSTKSSTTLAKALYTQKEPLPTYIQDQIRFMTTPKQVKDVLRHENVGHHWFSPEICNISKLSTHDRNHAPVTVSKGASKDRFTPYRSAKEKPMAKAVKSGAPVKVRKPSVKSFSASRHMLDIVARQKKDAVPPKHPSSNKPVKVSSVSSKKDDSRVGKEDGSERGRNATVASNKPVSRDRSTASTSYQQRRSPMRSVSKDYGPKRDVKRRTTRLQSSRKVSVIDKENSHGTREESFMASASYPGQSRKRRPSILSTKVRKHSSPSAQDSSRGVALRQSVRRGQVSPQTTSLYYSFKLLEEFDYVRRRLKEIQQLRKEHMEAIADLDRERVRLEAVLSHVHTRSRVTDQTAAQ